MCSLSAFRDVFSFGIHYELTYVAVTTHIYLGIMIFWGASIGVCLHISFEPVRAPCFIRVLASCLFTFYFYSSWHLAGISFIAFCDTLGAIACVLDRSTISSASVPPVCSKAQ